MLISRNYGLCTSVDLRRGRTPRNSRALQAVESDIMGNAAEPAQSDFGGDQPACREPVNRSDIGGAIPLRLAEGLAIFTDNRYQTAIPCERCMDYRSSAPDLCHSRLQCRSSQSRAYAQRDNQQDQETCGRRVFDREYDHAQY